jgi:hypothetical protein
MVNYIFFASTAQKAYVDIACLLFLMFQESVVDCEIFL